METLSEQLTELYESKWNGLMEQLEANGLRDKLQCPFLISLLRSGQKKEEREKEQALIGYDKWYAQKGTSEHEEWYTKADITRVRDKDCVKNRVKRAKIVRITLC